MNVLIIRSFVDTIDGEKWRCHEGQELEMPAGAKWIEDGFAVPARGKVMETAAVKPEERAVKPAAQKKATRSKPKPKGVMSTKSLGG